MEYPKKCRECHECMVMENADLKCEANMDLVINPEVIHKLCPNVYNLTDEIVFDEFLPSFVADFKYDMFQHKMSKYFYRDGIKVTITVEYE